MPLDRPIFIVCAGRSGSTLYYRILAQHRDLGWLSTFNQVCPRHTSVSIFSRLYDKRLLRGIRHASFFPKPFASYNFWKVHLPDITRHDRPLLPRDVPDQVIEPLRTTVAQVLKYQGKRRFLAKVTGWARMAYFDRIFPDAQFLYLRRDPVSIVGSWVRAGWLNVTADIDSDDWEWGEVPEPYRQIWNDLGRGPLLAAAVKTQLDIDDLRRNVALFPDRTYSLDYETFVAHPHDCVRETLDFCGLPWDPRLDEIIDGMELRRAPDSWSKYLSADQARLLLEFFERANGLEPDHASDVAVAIPS